MPLPKASLPKNATRANKSLHDGLKCLQWILTQRGATSLQDLAKALGFETTRVHRLLKTFVQAGFLRQTSGRKYEPGPAVFYMAMHTLHESHLLQAALPPLERLRRMAKQSVAMGVYWNRTVSYLYHAAPSMPIEQAIGGCGLYPASNSGIGLMVLAQMTDDELREIYDDGKVDDMEGGIGQLFETLEEIRGRGYAYISLKPWVTHTLAIPMKSNPTMSVAVAGKITEDEVPQFLPLLRQTVDEIEAALHPGEQPGALESLKLRRQRGLI